VAECNGNELLLLRMITDDGLRPAHVGESDFKDMPDELRNLMMSCWDSDPQKRPESFAVIRDKLFQIASGLKKKPSPQKHVSGGQRK